MEMRMQQLDHEYHAKSTADKLRPSAGLEERLAGYRQEIEAQAKAEVQRQVKAGRGSSKDIQADTGG
jgi:hypothetical protein